MRKTVFSCLLFIQIGYNFSSFADVRLLPSEVSLKGQSGMMDTNGLRQSVLQRSSNFEMDCAEISELPGAYLCMANSKSRMNMALTRIGIFQGQSAGIQPGTVVEDQTRWLRGLETFITGHNLPGDVIGSFFDAEKSSGASHKLNTFEKELRDDFVNAPRIVALGGRYDLIAVDASSPKEYWATISHEIRHAQAYLHPAVQAVIAEFWRSQVSEQDKAAVRKILASKSYNPLDEKLMADEFQAYILEDGAEHDFLSRFVGKYRKSLLTELEKVDYVDNSGSTTTR